MKWLRYILAHLFPTRSTARSKGYEEHGCPICHNFTIVRTGLSTGYCDTCKNVLIDRRFS